MKDYRKYTEQEINEIRLMREQGATYAEIGKMFGRTTKAIGMAFNHGVFNKKEKVEKVEKVVAVAPVKQKTLHDFTPREMIRYLYNMGYRIEDGRIVLIRKEYVNLKSILEED